MLPLYVARIEDLGPGDFVKVDCAGCHHVALLTPEALLRVGLSPAAKVLDLKGRLRCRGCIGKLRAESSAPAPAVALWLGRWNPHSRNNQSYASKILRFCNRSLTFRVHVK
jgi:hypothetical protein